MADRPKPSTPHSDHAAPAQYENRFAEVQRKSREARERLNAASQVRAERRESVERDRDYVRADVADAPSPAPHSAARSTAAPRQRPVTAIERAAALLDSDAPIVDEIVPASTEAGDEEPS